MTMPIHINTLDYANRLAAGGIERSQADTHASALGDALALSIVVVPDDLAMLRTEILARFDVFKVEIYARLDALEQSLNARMDALEQSLNARMAALEARMTALEARMTALEKRVTGMYLLTAASLAVNLLVALKIFYPHG